MNITAVIAVLPMVMVFEVAKGVEDHLDNPVARWDNFKSICL